MERTKQELDADCRCGRPQDRPARHPAADRDRRVSLIVTEMAVIEPTEDGLVLRERGPGVSTREIEDATGATLVVKREPPEMRLD
jgi:acyl CoA:acetate/3-ketoacid CoA transferase beta subunit